MVEPWKQVAPVEVVHMTRIDDLYIGTCRFLKVALMSKMLESDPALLGGREKNGG